MDPKTRHRLMAAGVDPDHIDDPEQAWQLLFEQIGRRATIIDRYAIEAAARGVDSPHLSAEDRERLSWEVLESQFPGIEMLGDSGHLSIEVVPYNPQWPLLFADWQHRIRDRLPESATVRHVGSTAVPGLAAKPIVDIQISVDDVTDEPSYRSGIESLGTALRSRDPVHRYFRPPDGEPRDVQIHICTAGSVWETDHLLFRDYLRAHPDTRDAYGSLKLVLASRYRDDRLAYTDAKTDFILNILDEARTWARNTRWSVAGA